MTSLQGRQIGAARSTPLCKSCAAPIMWVRSRTGKKIPLDPEPVPDGNIVLINGAAFVTTTADPDPTTVRYVSHFATCSQASQWRKG